MIPWPRLWMRIRSKAARRDQVADPGLVEDPQLGRRIVLHPGVGEPGKQGLLGVQEVLGLVKHYRAGRVNDLVGDLGAM